jgi:hypothetical protein
MFPLVMGGMIGGIAISLAVIGVLRRVLAVVVYSAVGGVVLTGILAGWFGVLAGRLLGGSGGHRARARRDRRADHRRCRAHRTRGARGRSDRHDALRQPDLGAAMPREFAGA